MVFVSARFANDKMRYLNNFEASNFMHLLNNSTSVNKIIFDLTQIISVQYTAFSLKK